MLRFSKFFSVQRGTPRESDTASRREEACLLNLCYVVAQKVTSQPDTVDMTVTFLSSHRLLELKSDPRENNSHPCAQRTLHLFCVVSHSCKIGSPMSFALTIPWNLAKPVKIFPIIIVRQHHTGQKRM